MFQWYDPLNFPMDACVCALKKFSKNRDMPRIFLVILKHLFCVLCIRSV